MAITEVAYCTRSDVQRALNLADTPRLNARVDAAVMSGARDVEGFLHRLFYPETKTVSFDVPDDHNLWLYEHELAVAPSQILSGGQAMTIGTDVLLRPRSGPPYRWLEARFSGGVYWQAADTDQDAISITSDAWNYPVKQIPVTTLDGDADDGNTLTVLDSSRCGPGDLILVESERIIVSDSAVSATGATLGGDLTDKKNDTTFTVSNGTLIGQGEVLWIAGERMLVVGVTGNTVAVERAVNGSVLSTHSSGAGIFAPRLLTVLRGQLGTAAVAHSDGATVTLLKAPSLVSELNLAYAINNTEQALSAYARPVGSGDNLREQPGRGVKDLAEDAYTAYGRQYRGRAI